MEFASPISLCILLPNSHRKDLEQGPTVIRRFFIVVVVLSLSCHKLAMAIMLAHAGYLFAMLYVAG